MAAKPKKESAEIEAVAAPAVPTPTQELERMIEQAGKLLRQLELQVSLQSIPADGLCPIFYEDELFHVALPWAATEGYQLKLATRRTVLDGLYYTQLFDLVPNLHGKTVLDIGAFTGLSGLVLRRFLAPQKLVMIEPQNIVQDLLKRTIAANPEGCDIELLGCVIDDETAPMARGRTRHDRLSETVYLRRDGGPLGSRSIDNLGIADIGFINLDIPGQKIYALRGALETLKSQRPILSTNLAARDADEVKAFMTELDYEFVRAGDHSALFLPK